MIESEQLISMVYKRNAFGVKNLVIPKNKYCKQTLESRLSVVFLETM